MPDAHPAAALLAATLCALSLPSAADEAGDPAPRGDRTAEQAGEGAKRTYTWEQLVELIPDLRTMQLEMAEPADAGADGEAERIPMVCRREAEIGSRIERRRCYTLEAYLRKRLFEEQYASDFRRDLRLR